MRARRSSGVTGEASRTVATSAASAASAHGGSSSSGTSGTIAPDTLLAASDEANRSWPARNTML
jgi:hypothetical protein